MWDVDDGTITVGASGSAAITATFPAGFRWVKLTVTDDNGKMHTTKVSVFARDPASDASIDMFQITSHRIAQAGQKVNVRITESIAETTYPDGTLVIIADGEPSTAADRSNLLFVGWHLDDPADVGAERTGTLKEVSLQCVDVAGKLDTLPAFPVSLEIANTPDKWEQMTLPNMDKFLHYILQWHSTAIDVADFIWSGTTTTYDFAILGTEGQSLYDTVDRKCLSLVPDYRLTCNTLGQLKVNPDPMLQETGDRTSTIQATLTEDDWADLRWTHHRHPTISRLTSGAALTGAATPDVTEAVLCMAPGFAPAQGENEFEHGEQLAESQTTLNKCAGHRYARMSAPESPFRCIFAVGADQAIEPADMTWVKLTMTAATAAQRGLAFTEAQGLPLELNVRYSHTRTGLVRTVEMLWERETSGVPAATWIPLVDSQQEDSDWWDIPNYTPPESGSDFYNPVKGYIIFDNVHIGRTLDILASPVVWELVDTGISGTIIDCQYVSRPNGNDTVGLWCLTSAGVFWCADILATTPSWTNKLSLATMQAAETAPDTGSARFASMFNHGARPGYLIVATEPDSNSLQNLNWPHAYFHFSDDYGATWTVQDSADELTRTTVGGTHGYMYLHKYAVNWYRDTGGRIYALRGTPRQTLSVETIIMYSDDDGATWIKGAVVPHPTNSWYNGALLNPFPATTDPLLVIAGNTGVSTRPKMYVSTDNGATVGSAITPTGMGGFQQYSRLNSRTFDPQHVIGVARKVGSPYDWTIVASDDAGSAWTTIHDTGTTSPQLETPNGWPADDNVWFTIRYSNGGSASVWMTDDYFSGGLGTDKTDNLLDAGVFNGWSSSIGGNDGVGGIALPKIGANA